MKRICILLALLMCAVLAFSAQAVEATAGNTVTVPIYVDTTGAYQLTLSISFDTSVFEYSAIRCFGPGGQASFSQSTQKGKMLMYDISDPIMEGEVGFITLTVKDGVDFGTYNVSVTVVEAWDLDENPVEIAASADSVVVVCPHTETKEEIVKEADCENDGVIECVCVECGELLNTLAIEKLGHIYDTWNVTLAPTCTEPGEEVSECDRCAKVETRVLEPLGHKKVVQEAVKETCTESGLTKGEYCSVCGEVFSVQTVVPATGHKSKVEEAVEPTCTEAGYTEGSYCSDCGIVLVAQKLIPALGHTEGEWVITVRPTTEAEGSRQKLCTVCGLVLVEREIPKLEKIETIADPVVETVKAKKGEEITLNVYVSSNKAAFVTVQVNYDTSIFEVISEKCDLGLVNNGKFLVYSLSEVINGKIGTITLKVKDEAEDGIYTIDTEVSEVFDFDENPVVCKAAVDKVKVVNRIPGDVTDDGIVDGRDLLRLAKHIGGFVVEINEDNSTVNGDDIIDGRDLLRLAKYIGGQDAELE